ncbi:ribosome-associated translation inhibitor RaiA [Sulfurimonas sp. MAG313]|nr:ribosome-associated translation inhibitor RaiA [Sulfurimonas sp. MAG313]MDF1881449.1 ribosome-associated translation inhibitor RaiA [Sulfurimonas sp. MAG313]
MNVNITGRHISLNDHNRQHIQAAMDSFLKYQLDITTVNVVVSEIKNGINVEFDMHIAHANPVVINQGDKDLDTAIDLAIERATKALRRLHDRVISHGHGSLKDLEPLEA